MPSSSAGAAAPRTRRYGLSVEIESRRVDGVVQSQAKRALMDIQKNGISALPEYAMDGEIQGLIKMLLM